MATEPVKGVVGVIPRDGQLLVIRRAEHIRAGGWWCFPGGAIEPGESVEQALVREIQEEVGIDVLPRWEVWRWHRPDGQLILHWWLANMADLEAVPVANPAEVAEVRWVTPDEMRCLTPALESNLLFLEQYKL